MASHPCVVTAAAEVTVAVAPQPPPERVGGGRRRRDGLRRRRRRWRSVASPVPAAARSPQRSARPGHGRGVALLPRRGAAAGSVGHTRAAATEGVAAALGVVAPTRGGGADSLRHGRGGDGPRPPRCCTPHAGLSETSTVRGSGAGVAGWGVRDGASPPQRWVVACACGDARHCPLPAAVARLSAASVSAAASAPGIVFCR